MCEAPQGRVQSNSGINRLPPELLSHIFLLGEESERITRPRVDWYHTFQDIATQVCGYWRHVAIGSPELWTHLHITRPPPHRLAILYLARAGPTTLLDVTIELRSRYLKRLGISVVDWSQQVTRIGMVLEFLAIHNAGPHRWKSLSVAAKQPEPLLEVISSLNVGLVLPLQHLSLAWKTPYPLPSEEDRCVSYSHLFDDSPGHLFELSRPTTPHLRRVDFTLVPWVFILDRPSPLFTGLTHLSLIAAIRLCGLPKLRNLLAANSQLESLELSSGDAEDQELGDEPPPVQLSSLRSLSMMNSSCEAWMLAIVKMIEAPGLQKLTLATGGYESRTYSNVLKYVSTGKLPSQQTPINDTPSADKLIYPSLRELDVSRVVDFEDEIADLLASLSTITRLTIDIGQAPCLGRAPWLLPKLIFLKLPSLVSEYLASILRNRAEAGFPVKVVEVPVGWQDRIQLQDSLGLSDLVTVVEYDEDYLDPHDYDGDHESDEWEASGIADAEFESEVEWMGGAEFDPYETDFSDDFW